MSCRDIPPRTGATGTNPPGALALKRRTALKLLAAGLLAPWMPARASSAGSMLTRRIPVSGESLPVVGLGTSDEFEVAGDPDLERLLRNEPLDFVQLNYSFTEPEAENRLLPLAADRGVAVMVNRPFENGALFRKVKDRPLPPWASGFDCESWAQFSLKYILAHPAVTCVIPATSNPRHLVDNMGAGTGRLPDEHTRKRMREIGAAL